MPPKITFPETLDAERLALRRYGSADAQAILELVDKNRTSLIQTFRGMADLSQVEEATSFIVEKTQQWNAGKAFCYGIWLKVSKEQIRQLIGQLQVKNVVWDVPSAELGYFMGGSSQRQGFATEAISAVLRLAFKRLGFERIFIRIIPSNHESISLANKLGFKHEGLHRNDFRCGFGKLHDVHYFSLTSGDYR
jgi:RimJ/RimL family protein N-acetyltransferase